MSMLSPKVIKMSWNSIPGLNYKVTCSNEIDKSWKSFYLGEDNYCLLDLNDSRFIANTLNSFSITGGSKGYFTSFIYGKLFISEKEKCITDPVIMEARAVKEVIEFFHTGSPLPLLCRASTAVKDKWMNTSWKKVLSYTSKHHYRFTHKDLDLDLSQSFSRLQFKLGPNVLDWIDIKEFMKKGVVTKRDTVVLVDRHSQGEESEEEEVEAGVVGASPAMASAIKVKPLSPLNTSKLPVSRGPRSVSPNSAKSTSKFPFLGGSIPSTSPKVALASPSGSHNSPRIKIESPERKSPMVMAKSGPTSQSPTTAENLQVPKRSPNISEGEIVDSPVEPDMMMDVDVSGHTEKPPFAPVKINRQIKSMEVKVEEPGNELNKSGSFDRASSNLLPSSPHKQSPKMELAGLLSSNQLVSQDSPIRPAVSPLSPVKKQPSPPAVKVVIDRNYVKSGIKVEISEPTSSFAIQRPPSNNSAESLPESANSEPIITPTVYRPKHLRHYFSNVPSAASTPASTPAIEIREESSVESANTDSVLVKRKPGRPRKEPKTPIQVSPSLPKRRRTSLEGSQSDYDDQTSSPKPKSASKSKLGKKKVGRPRKISSQDDGEESFEPVITLKTSQWPVEGVFDIDHSIIGHENSEFYYHLGYGEKFDVFVDGGWRTGRVHYYVPTVNKTWGLMVIDY